MVPDVYRGGNRQLRAGAIALRRDGAKASRTDLPIGVDQSDSSHRWGGEGERQPHQRPRGLRRVADRVGGYAAHVVEEGEFERVPWVPRLFENTLDLAQKEVFEVTSRAKNPLQVLRDYIDKPLTEISLKEGKSLLQVLLKGELVWDAGLRGIASASYRDPAEGADFIFRATTKREGALKQVQNAVAEEGLVDIASIEKLVGDLTDEGLVHALGGLGEVNLMIKTLGYAWVATGTKAAPRSEALLRSFAIDLIKKVTLQ